MHFSLKEVFSNFNDHCSFIISTRFCLFSKESVFSFNIVTHSTELDARKRRETD